MVFYESLSDSRESFNQVKIEKSNYLNRGVEEDEDPFIL
jgi:hypothetical protein